MFDKFTDHARYSVVQAQQVTFDLGHDAMGTGHILTGILRGDGTGGRVLKGAGATAAGAQQRLREVLGEGDDAKYVPFTPGAKKLLERSLRAALVLGHNYVGTGHMVIALSEAPDSTGARILVDMGMDPMSIASDVQKALGPDDAELSTPVDEDPEDRRRRRWRRPRKPDR